jgi:nitrite reductase/ring-hydroxylating ferredoxin subunit
MPAGFQGGRVFAFENRCPHMGFPLKRGSVEDGILTSHAVGLCEAFPDA